MSANCPQQSLILTLQGLHGPLLPSISKHLEKFTILTDQIIHTLKNEFVYFCM